MHFKTIIAKLLSKEVSSLKEKQIIKALEIPPDSKLGDYAFPCFLLAKELKKNPNEIAKNLSQKLKMPKELSKAEAAGPYLNFFVNSTFLTQKILTEIFEKKENFGKPKPENKKIVVEYSQPNPNKPLHLGHLRNDSIGMAFSNLLEFYENKVARVNIINDRGIHICQGLVAYKKFGKNSTPEKEKLKGDKFAGKYYVLFHEKAKKDETLEKEAQKMLLDWERKDKNVRALWKKSRDWALEGFKETYKTFGSEFDKIYFESDLYDKAKPLIKKGLKTGVFVKDDKNRIIADLEKYKIPNKIILRSDGSSIYINQDMVLMLKKFKDYKFDESYYVVASEQDLYFKQLFKIMDLLGYSEAKKSHHLSYGLVLLPEGKLKSREGNTIDADDLIKQLKNSAQKEIIKRFPNVKKDELEKRALKIALAAIKFSMLKIDSKKNFTFVPQQSLSFEGDSGPYLMYSYARAKGILRKASNPENADFSLLKEKKELEVIKKLWHFKDAVQKSRSSNSMHHLCIYLNELATSFNSFYQDIPVLNAENKETVKARLSLVKAFSIVLKKALKLLNVEPLEQM